MPKTLPYAALAAAIAIAGPALAQTTRQTTPPTPMPPAATNPAPQTSAPSVAPPSSTTPAPSTSAPPSATAPTGTDAAANAGASTTLMSGMSVKDNTGALIGEVKSVKNGVATIQMGSDTFAVDTDKLGVANGAASINATQAELKKMLPAKK